MAYTAGSLHLRAGAPGDLSYTYDAASDTMATVATSGYFNNSDDDLNLTVDDLIWCQCTDGNMWQRVSAISSGTVTTQHAGGNLPIQTFSTGTTAILNTLGVGFYEVGTSVATASRNVLPTPYAGAELRVLKVDSGSQIFQFDAGGSGATGITFDAVGNRVIKLQTEGEMFHVVASSSTRWRVYGANTNASAVAPSGGSVFLGGT
jgi:hypothetical protein|tara:strand:+ start:62 stop:676 length:615 start_codon:yes stop_codon:yes gene_type:complete